MKKLNNCVAIKKNLLIQIIEIFWNCFEIIGVNTNSCITVEDILAEPLSVFDNWMEGDNKWFTFSIQTQCILQCLPVGKYFLFYFTDLSFTRKNSNYNIDQGCPAKLDLEEQI